jgi:multiple sugar transport system substrate-binding protein
MMMIELMENYDIVQINEPWLNECARNHFLEDLSKYFNVLELDYPQEVLDCYAIKDHKQYAIPYVLGAQLLFYRKDLFSDLHYQRLYYEMHHQELQPPRTWSEFDKVAHFFTQSLNPKSPVKYGIAMSAHSTDALYLYVPMLWELQGSIFNAMGELVFNTPKSAQALENLKGFLQYTDPSALRLDLNEQAQLFFQGQAAMLVAYQSHLMDYQNDADAVYAGKVGIASAPGQMTVRGGWALTINARSDKKAAAAAFMKWLSSPENIIPYNVLGGSNPGNAMLESEEIAIDFPWFTLACRMMGRSRPMISVNAPVQQATFEGIAARIIEEFLHERIPARQAVEEISDLLTSLSPSVRLG